MGIDLTTVEREDAKTAVLTVGAVRDLIGRLDRLEDVGKRPGTISLSGVADATLELDRRVKKLERAAAAGPSCATAELLQALRAAGVTRYQAGELAIELNPAAAPGPVIQQPARPVILERSTAQGPEDCGPLADDAPEPIESPSGIEVDHEALRAKLEDRRRATRGAK